MSHTTIRATFSALLLMASLSTAPASAAEWEGELAAGPASSNAPSGAIAIQGRAGISLFSHASLSLRAIDFAGSAARDGGSKAFNGWMALAEVRLHTGHALGIGRLHLALAAGVGREIAVSPGPYGGDGDPGPVEVGRTGPAFLVSLGGALKAGEVALSVDVAVCYWTRFESVIPGDTGANGGLGAALLFGLGVLP